MNFQTTKKQRRRDSWKDSYFDILPPPNEPKLGHFSRAHPGGHPTTPQTSKLNIFTVLRMQKLPQSSLLLLSTLPVAAAAAATVIWSIDIGWTT